MQSVKKLKFQILGEVLKKYDEVQTQNTTEKFSKYFCGIFVLSKGFSTSPFFIFAPKCPHPCEQFCKKI